MHSRTDTTAQFQLTGLAAVAALRCVSRSAAGVPRPSLPLTTPEGYIMRDLPKRLAGRSAAQRAARPSRRPFPRSGPIVSGADV